MVHRRQIEGEEIVLGNQGALWGNAMTWWDHETGSVWSQPLGEAIAGPLQGTRLELVPSTMTTWGAWKEAHPDTVALDAPGAAPRFDLRVVAIAVEFGDEAVAFDMDEVIEHGVANDVVAGAPLAVVADPTAPLRWAVFSRRLDDRTITLEVRDGRLTDVETATTWDPQRGIGLDGPLRGEVLDLLPGFTVFPRDFETFWPNGRFWEPTG